MHQNKIVERIYESKANMQNTPLSNLYPEKAPEKLLKNVLHAVHSEIERARKIRLAFRGGLSFISLIALFPAFSYLTHSFTQTSFYQYAQLAFSDSNILFSLWKEFAASLIESLPLTSIIAFLSVILVFIWSFTNTLKDSKQIFLKA